MHAARACMTVAFFLIIGLQLQKYCKSMSFRPKWAKPP